MSTPVRQYAIGLGGAAVGPLPGSGAMFDQIAHRYDVLNRLLSCGLDRRWRRALVQALGCGGREAVLDVATGTADVPLALCAAHPQLRVTGVDLSAHMLSLGHAKVRRAALRGRVTLRQADAQELPFAAASFAGACIAFGIRNVPDRLRGLREMVRVTRPGGRVVVLELAQPRGGVGGFCGGLYVQHVVPWLGALLSGAWQYRYLARSVAAFPPPQQFADLMRQAGLRAISYRRLTWGAVYLYSGVVPS